MHRIKDAKLSGSNQIDPRRLSVVVNIFGRQFRDNFLVFSSTDFDSFNGNERSKHNEYLCVLRWTCKASTL